MCPLPNNYYYISIDEKIFNIKQVYKLLSILIKDKIVKCNTVITITGKYGERGSLHLPVMIMINIVFI